MDVPGPIDVKKDSMPENETSTQVIKKLSIENKPGEIQPRLLSLKDVKETIKESKQEDDSAIISTINNHSTHKANPNVNATVNSNINMNMNTNSNAIQKNKHNSYNDLIPNEALPHQKTNVHLIITEKTPGLFKNQQSPFTINEYGLEGNAKNAQANFIFFGLDESDNLAEYPYDVVMSIGAENQDPTELFYILYENNSKNYILKSLTKEFFFSNVIVPYQQIILEDHQKNYFKTGKVVMSIYPRFSDESIELIIKKGESITVKQKLTFTKGKFPVSIGRSNCSVNLPCDGLSKCHASIDFDLAHNRFFFIDNASTNGSQLLLNKGKNLKLSGEKTFNINDRLFTIKENYDK